jgi:mevalonate kinase
MNSTPSPAGLAWGKVMLFGEYAVLEGAPALLTSTPHRAKATFLDFEDQRSKDTMTRAKSLFDVAAENRLKPSYLVDGGRWGIGLLCYHKVTQELVTLGAQFDLIYEALNHWSPPCGLYQIDTALFGTTIDGVWSKMGIGSSGASTAALVDLFSHMTPSQELEKPPLKTKRD